MKVKDLVQQVISYSHDEDSSETRMSEKSLVWINSAYHELLQENLPFLRNKLLKIETKNIENSYLELPKDFYLLDKIILENGKVISKDDKEFYDIELNKLYLGKNISAKNADIRYIPEFPLLKLDDDISSLHMGTNYADALIWGALVWSSIYERGLHTKSEVTLFESKWEKAKRNFKLSLQAYSSDILRTKPYSFFN